jgi:hypothetical protein
MDGLASHYMTVLTSNIPVSEKLYDLEVWLPSGTFDMVLSSSSSKVVVLWKLCNNATIFMTTPQNFKTSLDKMKSCCDERWVVREVGVSIGY